MAECAADDRPETGFYFDKTMAGGRVIRGLRAAADILLPRRCIVCGRKLLLAEEHLCLYCLSDIPHTYFWTVKHNPMSDKFNSVLQKHLEEKWETEGIQGYVRERYAYANALFFYDSDGDYRHIPYQIKYHGNTRAGRFFGNMLGQKVAGTSWMKDIDIVIPVPLHWRRKWARGYNQAEIIAAEVASVLNVPLKTDILKRRRYTRTQTKMDIPSKSVNVADAFTIQDFTTCGHYRHILLVDDVFTSGSTLMACFTALRAVFPPSVRISVATLAFVGEV